MDVRIVLAACLLGWVCGQPEPEDKCGGLECPRYSVEQTGEGFEVRQYEPAKWVAMNVTSGRTRRRMHRCMHSLSSYMDGENSQGVTMERTMPMLKKLVGDMAGPDFQKTMMMMLPMDQQANPPTPTDSELTIVELPAMTVYAAEMESARGRGCGMRCGRHGNRMSSHHGRHGSHRGGRRGGGRGRSGGYRYGPQWDQGQDGDSEQGQRRRWRKGRRFGRHRGRNGNEGWEQRRRPNRKSSDENPDVTIARLRRAVQANGMSRPTRWQQFMQSQVDSLRESLGDRTVRENVMYVAMYGRPHSRTAVKELWLVAA